MKWLATPLPTVFTAGALNTNALMYICSASVGGVLFICRRFLISKYEHAFQERLSNLITAAM